MLRRIKRTIKHWQKSRVDLSDQPKIFGLGLSRTGTTTLTIALRRLGYRIQHFPSDSDTVRELSAGQTQLSLLRHNDGITDITTIPFYKQLDLEYPGSKFILTVREPDSWLISLEQLLEREPPENDPKAFADKPEVAAFRKMLRETVYGSDQFDREKMLETYHRHYQDVIDYFTGRQGDLLELNITAGEGYEKLAPFLGHAIIDEPLPRLNAKPDVKPEMTSQD